jgi:type II restriction enzyme
MLLTGITFKLKSLVLGTSPKIMLNDPTKAAKERLESIISKARIDLYKPIQVAEVLRRSRLFGDIDIQNKKTYQNPSIHWRNLVTKRLLGKVSTSSARYQHDLWNDSALPPSLLSLLDAENKRTHGNVERFIYLNFKSRQNAISEIISYIELSKQADFRLMNLIEKFTEKQGLRRSIDKAYEIISYSLFETVVVGLDAVVTVTVSASKYQLLAEFSDLVQIVLGLSSQQPDIQFQAHLHRVGVTNAADRGLDMWANFGPAIQVKHLSLRPEQAQSIVDQIESDSIVIVCRDADAEVIKIVTQQISWGQRVRGVITESQLSEWYDRCLRGSHSDRLGNLLMQTLLDEFREEFPQTTAIIDFLSERGYLSMSVDKDWTTSED